MKSLLARLLLIMSVAMVPALGFQAYNENVARHARRHLVEGEALRLVRLVASEQQRIVEGAEQVLNALSSTPAVQDKDIERCHRLLTNLLQMSSRYNTAYVLGLDGRTLCGPGPIDPPVAGLDRSYFQMALQSGGFVVGDYAVGRGSGMPTIHMAKPFKNSDGMVAGVVAVALSIDWLAHELRHLPLPTGAIVTIADRNGTFLVRLPGQDRFSGQPIPAKNRFILDGNEVGLAQMTSLDHGRPVIVAYSPLGADPKGLSIGVGLDLETTFATVEQANWIGFALIFLGAALALAMTALLGTRLIGRPMNRLLSAAQRWRTGDLAARTGLREDGSEFGRLGGAFDDMAEAQEARERALRRSEEHFRATFEQAAVGMAQVGMDGTWRRVNDRLCDITGYTRDELLTHKFWDITHPDDLEADFAVRQRLLSGELATFTREKRYLRKDGAVVWVSLTASLLRNSDGKPERVLSVVEDITERRRMKAELQSKEARLRAVMEQIPAAVSISEPPDGRVVIRSRYSDVVFGTHGIHSLANSGARRDSSEHPDGRPYAPEEYPSWRALNRGETVMAEPTLYRRTDGALMELEVYAAPVRDAAGNIIAAVAAAFDVSGRNRADRLLAQSHADLEARVSEEVHAREAAQARAAHAERLNALGQLAGGIAHDFNNVLQAVEGAAVLIERRSGNDADVRRLARVAIDAAARGASITRRLLAFGRRGDLRAETLDVVDLLSGLREIFAHTLGAAIEVHVRLGANLPPLLADKGQLETVLVNLATNARDAMPHGGRLTLSADEVTVPSGHSAHPSELAAGQYVRLAVTDTGVGIDADTLAHVCEPFFTTKAIGIGTGLGLPMAKGFAEQSGGALDVASGPGRGTTVTVWLPAAAVGLNSGVAAPRAAPMPRGAGGAAASITGESETYFRVLLVDDEDLVREMLVEHLEDAGFSVVSVASGAEALAVLASAEVVDALVTDLAMPGIDGLAVIRAAQERRPGLPTVLLTGYAGDGAALAVGGAISGAFSLLRKPVRVHDLADRIQSLIAARKSANR